MKNSNLRTVLSGLRPEVRKSERNVLDFILANMQEVQRMTLSDLAQLSNVSEPTVMRFCKAVGAKGFTDFKVWVTQSIAAEGARIHRSIDQPIAAEEVVKKVFGAAESELKNIRNTIDSVALRKASSIIANASRIVIFATGSSNVAAVDVFQHLNRYGLPVSHTPDLHIQTQTAATLSTSDVAIFLSFTGALKDNVRMIELAKQAGADTIVISRQNSPLAILADVVINVDPVEDTFVFSPMSSLVAQLVACDALCTCVALSFGSVATENLSKAKMSLKHLWIEETD